MFIKVTGILNKNMHTVIQLSNKRTIITPYNVCKQLQLRGYVYILSGCWVIHIRITIQKKTKYENHGL